MIIQVGRLHYEAPEGVRIGDRVRTPPDGEEAGKVTGFGRDGYDGRVRRITGVIRTVEYRCTDETEVIPPDGDGWSPA